MNGAPAVSVVIITWRRAALILDCLESLDRAGMRDAEAWVAVNGEDESADAWIGDARRRFPWLQVVRQPRMSRGRARNRLVERARGRLLLFLDDDVVVPPGYLRALAEKAAAHPDAPWLGGPNVGPPDAGPFARAVDFVLRSPVAAGPARVRYLARGPDRRASGWSFTLANLAVRREVFEAHGCAFPEVCVCAEENLFMHRVERRLGPGLWSAELKAFHRRRDTFPAFARQIAQYGRGRMQITRAAPASLHPAVFAPALAAAGGAAWVLGCFPGLDALAAAYALLALAEGLRMCVEERDPAAALRVPVLIPLMHACYAGGFLSGLAGPGERPEPAPAAARASRMHA